jgi:LmbE family N-acetylglucosaminyl deacetylase
MYKKLLVVCPHQDDETIGCGGLIQRVLEDGGEVAVAYATYVEGEYKKYIKEKGVYRYYTGQMRKEETLNALKVLGNGGRIEVKGPLFPGELHHRMDIVPLADIIAKIEQLILEYNPDILAVPSSSWNQDHEALNRACDAVSRPYFYSGHIVEYEVTGEKYFIPNFYIKMSEEQLMRKIRAMECYQSQYSGDLHKVSIPGLRNLAESRGRDIYEKYAEAYMIKRLSWK